MSLSAFHSQLMRYLSIVNVAQPKFLHALIEGKHHNFNNLAFLAS
ncbi:hypothetical protein VIC_003722 [Vibrio coralliilyticus ATCC BAA-450]|nr:hypothetical protein VIC_003722 [Vibrio coralliilyticus ATCC BAA-450]QFT39083.1 hypothetical protein FIU99_22160 [Vibrio sp. THAF64]QGM36379.1 hypothetical protein GGC04_19070 [Vibrio sp. THAF191d]QGN71720.1 hypothetical protein GGC03_18270 [Vibrio sp. THAF191c]